MKAQNGTSLQSYNMLSGLLGCLDVIPCVKYRSYFKGE